MESNEALQIDVNELIRSKSLKLHKRLPRFIINYLKRIVHQDEINQYLRTDGNVKGLDFVDATIDFLEVKKNVIGIDNIPDNGRFVFASNHPLGGLESIVFMQQVARKYKDLKFPVNDILMNLKNLDNIFVPISKFGAQSRENAKKLDEVFESDAQVLYFPAGYCSRKIKGKVVDLRWQKTFVAKAKKYKRDIVSVYIGGKNSNFFYNLSNFRRFFGIKANIEMLYLVDEMFKQRGQTIDIVFSEPFSHENITSDKNFNEWAEFFNRRTYSLNEKLKD